MNTVQPKSWFGLLGSVVLGVTFAMTACSSEDGDDGDGGGGSSNGGSSNGGATNGGTSTAGAPAQSTTGGNASATGGASSSAGGIPGSAGVAGRQAYPNLRKNTAPSAN